MSLRPSFAVLEDKTSEAGKPWQEAVVGEPIADVNKGGVIIAKDAAGNLQMPLVNDECELVVNLDSGNNACLTDEGSHAGSNAAFEDLANITLTASTIYKQLGIIASCFRDTKFEIVAVDDFGVTDVETLLATIRVGAGDYNLAEQLDCIEFTSGSTGVQALLIRGQNDNAESEMNGTLSILEVV